MIYSHKASIIVLLVIVVLSLLATTKIHIVNSETNNYTSIVYGFRVNLTKIGITPRYVSAIDESRVIIVGSLGKIHGVIVLDIVNPYDDPIIEDVYPLTGVPTYVTTDGYPATRFAVGSDKGEVLLMKIDSGRITRHLYAVLGADFYVNELFLTKVTSNVKIIALVSEGGPRGYPCMNCYVYVLDEEAKGVLRIGPKTGNATFTCPGLDRVNVQGIVPLAIYGFNGYYWDSSNVAVTYIPSVIKLLFDVIYVNETTEEIIRVQGALVEVSLQYNETGSRLVYGINVDSDGVARVPIPREVDSALVINLTIRDISGAVIWRYDYVLDPRSYIEIPDEIILPTAVLPTMRVDTRSASKVYGVPPFLNIALDLVDLTEAPLNCIRKAAATFFIKTSVRDLIFLKGDADDTLKIMYTEPDDGFLTVIIASLNETNIGQITRVVDYVGVNTIIASSGIFNDGRYLIAGLSDGRIRLYIAQNNTYMLRDIYTMGSSLYNLVMIPSTEGYTYVAISSRGVQVLVVDPYSIPIYRNIASLYLTIPGFLHGDTLANLSTIILADLQGITVIKNSQYAVLNRLLLTDDKIMARDIELTINAPASEDLSGSIVVLKHPWGESRYIIESNSLTLKNILPGVNYTVSIIPSKCFIYNATFKFNLKDDSLKIIEAENAQVYTSDKCCRVLVNTTYIEYNVKLRILDKYTGPTLPVPIDIYVDDTPVVIEGAVNEYSLKILYGQRLITIQASKGYEGVYQPHMVYLFVDRDIETSIILDRNEYPLIIRVSDMFGVIESPLELVIEGPVMVSRTIEQTATLFSLILPYGDYTLRITPHDENIYLPYERAFTLRAPHTLSIVLQRVKYKVELNVISKLAIIGKFELYVNGTKVASDIGKQVTIELPYGSYTLQLVPMAGWEGAYEPSNLINVAVTSDISISIPVERRSYTLKIVVMEQAKPITNAMVYIYSVETGELITALLTNENGYIQARLQYGVYRLEIFHEQYNRETLVIAMDKDYSEIVSLKPTFITLTRRFLPVIGSLIGVGLAIYIAMKIRTIIARRLITEEMF
ncbi:MAG: hypothetical protein QXE81_01465 [Desulfurococcaceae archaeon]